MISKLNALLMHHLEVSAADLHAVDAARLEQEAAEEEQQQEEAQRQGQEGINSMPPAGVVVELGEAPDHAHLDIATVEAPPVVLVREESTHEQLHQQQKGGSISPQKCTGNIPADAEASRTTNAPSSICEKLDHPAPTAVSILREVIAQALPTTAVYVLIFLNQTVTLMFVGQMLGTEQLAGYALGNSIFNVVGLTLTLGIASAITTLVSQAYGRNRDGNDAAKEYQKGLYIILGLGVIPSIAFQFMEPLLVHMFGDPLGVYAAQFLRTSPIQLVVIIANVTMTRALQAQRLPQVSIRGTILSTIACPILCAFLAPYGIEYAVIAVSLSLLLQALVIRHDGMNHPKCIIFNCKWPVDENILTMSSIKGFLRLGIPMAVAGSAEGWAFEAQVFVVTRLGNTSELAAINICFSMLTVFFGVPIGSSSAAATFTGNFLGGGKPRLVITYLKFVAVWAFFCAFCVFILLLAFGKHFVRAYTNDATTLAELHNLMPLLALFHFLDAIELPVQGVFRGAGRQTQLFRVMVTGLWAFQFPIGSFLTLHTSLRAAGVLVGFILGYMVVLPWMVSIIKGWSLEKLAEEAGAKSIGNAVADVGEANKADGDLVTPRGRGTNEECPAVPSPAVARESD